MIILLLVLLSLNRLYLHSWIVVKNFWEMHLDTF